MKAEGIRRGADHIRQLTVLGDGAAWIWGIATAKFPGATQIVDLYHARAHLHSLTRSLEFMLGDRKNEWLAARLEDLDLRMSRHRGRLGYPVTSYEERQRSRRNSGYFENNAPRMRYHWFRSRGLFVGSGVVEASCKTVVGQRLKRAGMHWTLGGADAIIALAAPRPAAPGKASATPRTIRHAPLRVRQGRSSRCSLITKPAKLTQV